MGSLAATNLSYSLRIPSLVVAEYFSLRSKTTRMWLDFSEFFNFQSAMILQSSFSLET